MTDCAEPAIMHRKVQLRFAARADHLVFARLVIAGIAVAEGLPAGIVSDLKLAVTEACTNAVEHAYAGLDGVDAADGAAPSVYVSYKIGPDDVVVEVEDHGGGFDLPAAQAATSTPNDRSGGMGLSIIETLVDDLSITTSGCGTRVAFAKRRDDPACE